MAGLENGPRKIESPKVPKERFAQQRQTLEYKYDAANELVDPSVDLSNEKLQDVKDFLYNEEFVKSLQEEYGLEKQKVLDAIFKVFQIRFGTEHPGGDQKMREKELRGTLKMLLS